MTANVPQTPTTESEEKEGSPPDVICWTCKLLDALGILEDLGFLPLGRLLAFAVGLDEEEGAADGISDGAKVDGETDGTSVGINL